MSARVLQPQHSLRFDSLWPHSSPSSRHHFPTSADSFSVIDPNGLITSQPLLNPTEQGILDEFFNTPDHVNDSGFLGRSGQGTLANNFNFLLTEGPPQVQDVHGLFGYGFNQHPHHVPQISAPHTPGNGYDILSQANALSHGIIVPPQHQIQAPMSMAPPTPMSAITTSNFAGGIQARVSTPYPQAGQAPTAQPSGIQQRRRAHTPGFTFDPKLFGQQHADTPVSDISFELPTAPRTTPVVRPASCHQLNAHARHHSESFITAASGSVHLRGGADGGGNDPNQRLYHFGTDTTHFAPNGFVRAAGAPTAAEITQRVMDEAFSAISLPNLSSVPSTPVVSSPADSSSRRRKREDSCDTEECDEPAGQRRKVSFSRPSSTLRSVLRRARASPPSSEAPASTSPLLRRRKSSPAGSLPPPPPGSGPHRKPPRENLTDEQKRSNHILSEQKRRNIIRRGFDYVNRTVPALREGGFSKSNVLAEATEYMIGLVAGNDALRRRLGLM